jgi:hypothetical protein
MKPWYQPGYDPETQVVPELWGSTLMELIKNQHFPIPFSRTLYPCRSALPTNHPDYEDGPEIYEAPYLDMNTIAGDLLSRFDAFARLCQTVNDQTSKFEPLTPTLQQLIGLWAIHARHWVYVNKYRQARFSTISLTWLLRDCMYLKGINGAVFAESEKTGKEALRKLKLMYDSLPSELKVKLHSSKSRGAEDSIEFEHGGSIQVFWASGRNPGMGRGFDRVMITEWGKVVDAQNAIVSFFPAFNRRANARVIIESTPGDEGTASYAHWSDSLAVGRDPSSDVNGNRKFLPVFLEYWRDKTCAANVALSEDSFSTDERNLLRIVRTPSVLAYRRSQIAQMNGDTLLFEKVFPRAPLSGWSKGTKPTLPEAEIDAMLETALKQCDIEYDYSAMCYMLSKPIPGDKYLIVGDGAKAGDTGDPSAMTIWSRTTWKLVGYWAGREQPGEFADRLIAAGEYFAEFEAPRKHVPIEEHDGQYYSRGLPALLVIEKNAGEVLEIVKREGYKHIWCEKKGVGGEGWTASDTSKNRGMGLLIAALRQKEIHIGAYAVVSQLKTFDGISRKKRQKDSEGNRHHYDLAMTVLIAADVLSGRRGKSTPSDGNVLNIQREKMLAIMSPEEKQSLLLEDINTKYQQMVSNMFTIGG